MSGRIDHASRPGKKRHVAPVLHALAEVVHKVPDVLSFLSTHEARHLRRVDHTLRILVGEHPWNDSRSLVYHPGTWRSAFPAARAISLSPSVLGLSGVGRHLRGVTSLTIFPDHSDSKISAVFPLFSRLETLEIALSGNFRKAFEALQGCVALRELTLRVGDLPARLLLQFPPSLRKLHLAASRTLGNGVTDHDLARFTHLEDLSLRGAFSERESMSEHFSGVGLSSLSRLRKLTLAAHFGQRLACTTLPPHLESLSLVNCELPAGFVFSGACPHLRSLHIRPRQLFDGRSALAGLTSLIELEIELENSALPTTLLPEAFVDLLSLEVIKLSGSFQVPPHLSDDVLRIIGRHSRLGDLDIAGCDVGGLTAAGWAALGSCPLSRLAIRNSSDVPVSASLPHLRALRTSCHDITESPFTRDVNTLEVSQWDTPAMIAEGFPSLRSLVANGVALSDAQVRALPTRLVFLSLDRCISTRIDDTVIIAISSTCAHLSHLSLKSSLHPEVGAWKGSLLSEGDWLLVDPCSRSAPMATAMSSAAADIGCVGTARAPCVHAVSSVGWAALVDKAEGFYSLDVTGNAISDASFALLRRRVADLRCSRIQSRPWETTWLDGALRERLEPQGAAYVAPPCGHGYFRRMLKITVLTLTGKSMHVCALLGDSVETLKQHIQDREGIPPDQQRLICGGVQLKDGRTLTSHGVTDWSIVHLVLRLRGDIGVFACADEPTASSPTAPFGAAVAAPGAHLLAEPEFPFGVDASEVSAIALAVGRQGRHYHARRPNRPKVTVGPAPLLSMSTCATLVRLVDAAFLQRDNKTGRAASQSNLSEFALSIAAGSRDDDFKLILDANDLGAAIGRTAGASLSADLASLLGGAVPDALVIRRTVGTGRWIGWHTDAASRTVQVPLSADRLGLGGRLVFISPDGSIEQPQRAPGVPIVHDGDAVHGVTCLVAPAVRYGLFALRRY